MHVICGMSAILPKNYSLKEGFDDMLEKPVTADRLQKLLKLSRAKRP
jgi:hypothetical protein